MKIVVIILACVVVAILAVVAIGYLLPVKHQAVREAELDRPPAVVWKVITAFAEAPDWRPDVKSVEEVRRGSESLWKEVNSEGEAILFQTVEAVPEQRLVRRIADENLPFGGRWTYELIARHGGCILRITEDGEVYNPVYRFMSRFVFGHTATLENYLRYLRTRLAEAPA